MTRFVRKGNQIAIEGRIQTNNYQDASGNNRQAFDILVESVNNLEPVSRNENQGYKPQPPFESGFQPTTNYQQNYASQRVEETQSSVEFEVSEDDLPF